MKRNYTPISRFSLASVLLLLISAVTLMGQTPSTFNYQALLRDAAGHPRENASVSVDLDIHQGTSTGTVVYSETHNTNTDEFGIVNLAIGSITPGTFASIDWSDGPYFVEVSVDGTSMGTSELLAVPYAMHANTVENITSYSVTSSTTRIIASTSTSSGHDIQILQIADVPAGTYAVFFGCPIGNTSTSSNGLNVAWSILTNSGSPTYPDDGVASSFIPASGWTANYIFGQSGFKIVTLGSTGTIELVGSYYGSLITGSVITRGTYYMTAIKL